MGASESVILYQKDIQELFPAGEIDLSFACEVVKCTPAPKNIIEDFTNNNNNNNNYLFIFILIFLFILLFLFLNKMI
jgi:hypothetical protein